MESDNSKLKIIIFLGIILAFLLLPKISWAATYYVSKSGSNTSSCINSPGPDAAACKSIMYVVNNAVLTGGDTVYIQAGTYDEHIILTNTDDGADGSYVTFKSYQNDDIRFICSTWEDEVLFIHTHTPNGLTQYIKWDGRGTDSGYHITFDANHERDNAVQIIYADHLWFTGINFTGGHARQGLKFWSETYGNCNGVGKGTCGTPTDGTTYSLFEYSKFYDNGDYGIKLTGYGTSWNTIRYCDIYNNGIAGHGSSYYGMNLSGSEYDDNMPDGNILHHNNFYSNYSSGIHILYARNTQVYNNKFYNNGVTAKSGQGLALSSETTGSLIYNNEIYGNAYYGFAIGPSVGISSNNIIYNNLIYNNCQGPSQCSEVIQQGTATSTPDSNKFYNNTIYSSKTGYSETVYLKKGTNTVFTNNIIMKAAGTGIPLYVGTSLDINTLTFWNNCLYGGGSYFLYYGGSSRTLAWVNDTWAADAQGNISENPVLDGNYKLTNTTPQGSGHVRDGGQSLLSKFTIDKDGISRPQGAAWDMGAYEYVEVAPPPDTIPPAAPTGLVVQ